MPWDVEDSERETSFSFLLGASLLPAPLCSLSCLAVENISEVNQERSLTLYVLYVYTHTDNGMSE